LPPFGQGKHFGVVAVVSVGDHFSSSQQNLRTFDILSPLKNHSATAS